MKLLTYRHGGRISWGAVVDDAVVDLGARLPRFAGLREALSAGALPELRQALASASPGPKLAEIEFLAPIQNPEKILCVGVNYANRNAEYADNSDLPKYPSLFMRTPSSLAGHGAPIIRPPESEQFDYEGEIVLIIGRGGRRIRRDDALQHIAGFTIMNEGSVRDWLRHGKFNVTQGKNFDRSGAIGPWMITADAMPDLGALRVTTRVNGEVRQDDTTASLIFGFDYLISYLSTFTELKPGDVISTGTPTGAGSFFKPPRWLRPGDVVEVEVSGIGTLRNTVADEA
ncbi:MAG: fumarylacetoacetate hydrolase family protein [Rhodospirillales bacterium]|nr:fumarylacetoacetate hydrolase family protein [Rhodospirillales bacterium]